MTDAERRHQRALAQVMWGGFWFCPTTHRIIESLPGDDKAICHCGRSNPKVRTEYTERTGTHIVRFLEAATVDEYITQREADETRLNARLDKLGAPE